MSVWLVVAVAWWCPVCPGAHRLRPRRAGLLPVRWCCWFWSGGCWQGAEPLPAGEECLLPWPAGADFQGPLAGVDGEAGGDVPDPVAERVRVGFPQFLVVAKAEEAGPGGDVGSDVRGDDPAAVDLPGLGGEVAQAHGLGGADACGLHDGVLAVDHVDVLGVVAAGHAGYPGVRDAGAGDGVLPA